MDGTVFTITLFLVFAALMLGLTLCVKGKRSVYLAAVTATLCGWFAGLLLDANIDFGGLTGSCLSGCFSPYWPWGSAFCARL